MSNATKAASFKEIKKGSIRNNQYGLILQALQENEFLSRNDLAEVTSLRLSSVCARVNELIKKDKVYEIGTVVDPNTNRTVSLLKLN